MLAHNFLVRASLAEDADEQVETSRLAAPEAFRPLSVGASGNRRAKRFAFRLRQRWAGRHAAIPVGEHVDPMEQRAKALRIALP